MRFNRIWVVGLVACTSAAWMACGGDDAAVNGDDSSGKDSGPNDATIGDGGNPGTDSGNPTDGGAQDSGVDSGCTIAFPTLPAGEVVCPGAPGGECTGTACCGGDSCSNSACLSAVGRVACERASDCNANHKCCLKLPAPIDFGATACPLTSNATSTTCATLDNCAAGDYVTCASDAECDGGTCRALSIQIVDGGTILGVCAP